MFLIIFDWLLKSIFARQDKLLVKIGLYLDLKKSVLNAQLNIKALKCGMRFLQSQEIVTSKVTPSLLID